MASAGTTQAIKIKQRIATSEAQQGANHDFLARYPTGNADYLAYAISFGPSRHHKV
jgi:hypothetical protein